MKILQADKQTPNPWDGRCPSRAVLNLIGDKWAMLLLPLLKARPHRNGELLRAVDGISQKVLTETLRDFEVHGLVRRHDYKTVPPKVDYQVTELGRTLAAAMEVLDTWVVEHFQEMADARDAYLKRSVRSKRNRADA